jgi:hypothetical protein
MQPGIETTGVVASPKNKKNRTQRTVHCNREKSCGYCVVPRTRGRGRLMHRNLGSATRPPLMLQLPRQRFRRVRPGPLPLRCTLLESPCPTTACALGSVGDLLPLGVETPARYRMCTSNDPGLLRMIHEETARNTRHAAHGTRHTAHARFARETVRSVHGVPTTNAGHDMARPRAMRMAPCMHTAIGSLHGQAR